MRSDRDVERDRAVERTVMREPVRSGSADSTERIRTAEQAPSDVSTYGQLAGAWGFPHVKGRCPSCGSASLFLAVGGHVTCSVIGCADPCAVDDWLARGGVHRPPTAGAHRCGGRVTGLGRDEYGNRFDGEAPAEHPLDVLRHARKHHGGYVIDNTQGNWLRCPDCGCEWEEDDEGNHISGEIKCLPPEVRAALRAVEQPEQAARSASAHLPEQPSKAKRLLDVRLALFDRKEQP